MKETIKTLRKDEKITVTDGNGLSFVSFEIDHVNDDLSVDVLITENYSSEYILFHRSLYQRILDELRTSETN